MDEPNSQITNKTSKTEISSSSSTTTSNNNSNIKEATPKKKTLKDFKLSRVLGEGSYSTVVKATEITSGKQCALKILSKLHIIKQNKVHIVNREKKILAMLSKSQFFVELYCTFQDEESLYFVLSLSDGGELWDYIKKLEKFTLDTTRFYAAEMFSAIYYLHNLEIVHRDLKPENILLNDRLHIMITDFGTSKILTDDTPPIQMSDRTMSTSSLSSRRKRSNSFVGTAQYVSPEMLNQSYSCKSSDIWAIGVIIFQMFTGKFAFNGVNEYHIFQNISKLEYTIPEDVTGPVKDLIQKILVLDPAERFGCEQSGGFAAVQQHPFFLNTQWDHLCDQTAPSELNAVYIDMKSKLQRQSTIDDEESLFSSMKQKKHKRKNKMSTSNSSAGDDDSTSSGDMDDTQRTRANTIAEDLNREVWTMFTGGHKIIRRGYLYKKKGFKPRKRMFIITDAPAMLYVDPENMVLKGYIPWTKELFCTTKNFVSFFIHTPKRVYVLEDRTNNSNLWIKTIEEVHRKHYGG